MTVTNCCSNIERRRNLPGERTADIVKPRFARINQCPETVYRFFLLPDASQRRESSVKGHSSSTPFKPAKDRSGSQEDLTARVRLSQDMPHRVFRGWTLLDSLIKQGLLSFTKDRQNNPL